MKTVAVELEYRQVGVVHVYLLNGRRLAQSSSLAQAKALSSLNLSLALAS